MTLSGLLVLVVQYVGKFSLPEGGSIFLFFVFCFLFSFAIMAGFGTYISGGVQIQ